MKFGWTKRFLAVTLMVCMLLTSLPFALPHSHVEAVGGVNSLTCAGFISNSTARTYIDTMMRYYINSSSTLQSTLDNGNSVVFMFEGGSDNYWSGTVYSDNDYSYRTQAVCIVVKKNSSGNAYIDYYCENSSSIPAEPTWCTNGVAYSGSTTLMDGTYAFYTWNHTGPYAAFQIDLTSSNGYCYYTPANNTNGYKSGASGINIHTRSTAYNGGSSIGWAWSEGCQVIGYGNDSSNEFNAFMKSVTGITWNPWISWTNKTLNTWGTTGIYKGYFVVDRQLGMIGTNGVQYGTGSLNVLYNTTALTNITAKSTAARKAAGMTEIGDYTSQCTYYPAYGKLVCTGTDVWSRTLPCYASTNSSTIAISAYNIGDELTTTGLFKNTAGEYWYRIKTTSSQALYVRAAYMEFKEQYLNDITLTGHTKPNGHIQGTGFVVDGTIATTYNQLTAVSAYIHDGLGTTGATETGYRATVSNNTYSLAGSVVDENTWMNVMGNGPHTMAITAEYKNCYLVDDTTVKTNTGKVLLAEDYFMVIPSSVSQSTCSHTYQNYPVGAASTSCTVESKTVKGCTTCGLMGSVTTSVGSHSFSDWVTTAATCTTAGSKVRTCSVCGTKETQTIAATGHSYTARIEGANCQDYGTNIYTCSKCGNSYSEPASAVYSEWSETKPEGVDESRIESKKQYRTSQYKEFTSYNATESGYSMIKKEWEQTKKATIYYVPSWPSGFDTTSSIYNEYKGPKKTASETTNAKTVINSDTAGGYLYYHWCYSGSYYSMSSKQGSYTTFHAYYATGNPSNYPCDTSDMSYKTGNTACCTNSDWYFVTNVNAQTYTEYKAKYTHGGWSSWTDWTDTSATASDTLKVEERTLYRYLISGYGDHVYENNYCTVCGAREPDSALYLFGNINGADYGENADIDNKGIYKFTDGSLVAIFTEDSYVGVKRGDNTAWYMTNGAVAEGVTSAILYNTNTGINSNRLFVPGNREITFTLVDNGNDTYTLSYTVSECKHNKHDLNGVCTACGETVEHTYSNGSCTVCGKPCTHNYVDGVCSVCGVICSHSFSEGVCTICGKACEHSFADGKCTICSQKCSHSWQDGKCSVCGVYCSHNFAEGECIICGVPCEHNFSEGSCTVCGVSCEHNFSEGSCTVCGQACDHKFANGVCAVCGKVCEHNYTDGTCTICGKVCVHSFENGACTECSTPCQHQWEGGTCTVCGQVCEHSFVEGACTLCGTICTHNMSDGACTICGVTCIHNWIDSNCTVCGKVCAEHSYLNGICAICGKEEPVYCLFGYINGSDYGFNGDENNAGIYKFKNGTLKTVFNQDSYVAVKLSDNSVWYMTDGYQQGATEVTLYDTTTGINADKLFVPKGRLVTFTLTVNDNSTLTLSYELAPCSHAVHNTDGFCTTCSESVEHTYSNGVCVACGKACTHSFEEGICSVCGYECAHIWIDGKCVNCGLTCEHSFTEGECANCGKACSHSFADGKCTVCGEGCSHSFANGQCTICGTACGHIYKGGVCSECGDVCEHTYENGICTNCYSNCEHNFKNDVCTICSMVCHHSFYEGECTNCGKPCNHAYLNGVCNVCGEECEHTFEDSKCTICNFECTHSFYEGKCTVCGAKCNHIINENTCTVCGSSFDYYLVGNINGANVGCEENYEFTGRYLFSDNTLSVVINTDSYVFLKTHDNQSWYLTDKAYSGNSATLYASGSSDASAMMFVPGGVKVAFTINHNPDGTITLSYEIVKCNHLTHDANACCSACSAMVSHTYFDGFCEVCGAKEPVVLPEINAKYAFMDAKEEIRYTVAFAANNFESINPAEMGILVLDENNPDLGINDAKEVSVGAYAEGGMMFADTNAVHPMTLGDTAYLRVYAKLADESYVYSDIITYNAVQYAGSVLKNPNSSSTEKALMVALLNYGAELQLHFGYNTQSLANAGLSAAQKAMAADYRPDMVTNFAKVDNAKAGEFVRAGKSAMLYPTASFENSLFSITYNCKLRAAAEGEVTLYYWDSAAYDSASNLTKENATGNVVMTLAEDGTYSGDITGIAAKDINDTIYVSVVYTSDSAECCTGVTSYSLAEYLKVNAGNSASDINSLAQAAVVYGYYAKSCFAD